MGQLALKSLIFGCTEEAALKKLEEDAHSDSEEQSLVLPVPF